MSLTLLSFKIRIELLSVLTASASFPSVFFQLQQYARQHPSFLAQGVTLITKTVLMFLAIPYLWISQFNSAFAVSFHSTRSHSNQVA